MNLNATDFDRHFAMAVENLNATLTEDNARPAMVAELLAAEYRKLARIAEIIEEVDRRAQFGANVTPTLREMTQAEMSAIYALAKGHPENWRPSDEPEE